MSRLAAVVVTVLGVLAGMVTGGLAVLTVAASPALALQTPQDLVVSSNPAGFTPNVLDGEVLAIAVVGNKVILGGDFTKAQNASGGSVLSRVNILAFDKNTGVIDPSFVPSVDAKVRTLAPGPDGHSVYVGGQFNNVNGQTAYKLALVDTNTGAKYASFNAGLINALVYDVKLVSGRLFIAGQFTQVNRQNRSLIAELDPSTGALKPGAVTFAGTHHGGFTMIYKFDTNPQATQLTAIGNFMTVNGLARVQVATFDISGPITLNTDWQTTQYVPMCYSSFQYYVRDIDYAPDGSYFVISSTGGYGSGPPTLCDTITRWATTDRGQSVMPTWVDYAGGDSTYAVAAAGAAIYGGGHTRWFNNPFRGDAVGPGAVPRSGIEALDPVNGLPLTWDPGRTRGRGVFDMVATDTGLWVGSDTDRIAGYQYHARIAFFPLAGGTPVPQPTPPALPADVYLAGQVAGPSQHIPYRVDAGGAELASGDTGPVWASDTTDPSPYRNSGSNAAGWSPVPNVDGTVPADTPRAIFDSERWDPGGGDEMQWAFSVPAGANTTVRLYLANRCTCTQFAGDRKFDVSIDGTTVLDDYDIVADVGHDVGTMKSFDIVSDGTVDIDFGHVIENPLINGIEIINNDAPADPPASPVNRRTFDGAASSPTTTAPAGSIDWPSVRGGFWLDGSLYVATTNGMLKVPFDGTSYGTPVTLDLYGLTQFQTEMSSMTSLVYDQGSIYFTLSGDANLYRRYFTVESGIVGAQRFTMPNGGVNWSQARGGFFSSDAYYWATPSGDLHRVGWSPAGPVAGSDTVVSGPGVDGTSWAARALFTLPGTVPNQPPTADINSGCNGLTCAFDGTGSSDPDGTIASYAWTFGDGDTSVDAKPSHTYAAAGTYTVGLTVTDNDGATASTATQVTVEDAATPVTYVGSAQGNVDGSSTTNQSVTLPPAVASGDALVMAMSFNSTSATVTDPAGWTRVDAKQTKSMSTIVWTRTATSADAGANVPAQSSVPVRSSLVVSAYRNAEVTVGDALIGLETQSRADHTTPSTTAPAGSWLVSVWSDKTASTTSWTAPAGARVLQTGAGGGAGHISWLLTDSNGPLGGAVGGLTATANSATNNATMITIVVAPTG